MKTGASIAALVLAISACVANAGVVTLIDPSLDSVLPAANYYTWPSVIDKTNTVGIGWFSDWESPKVKSGQGTNTTFYNMANAHNGKAAFAISVNETAGASIFQTVWLDTGNTYTLTAAVCTATRTDTTILKFKDDAKFALVFAPFPIEGIQTHGLVETAGTMRQQFGTFTDYSVSFTPATSGYYNIGLQNRGYLPGTGDGSNASTIFFDNARLSYIPVPEPTTALLLIAGGMLISRRRRHA
jgi:hypothetical protein